MSTSRLNSTGCGPCASGSTRSTPGMIADCPPPDCPACGELTCLCRPRFFAGQLLTEQDLNRLDRYIVEKRKLQNRHLFGWGTVTGLEVRCDGCGPGVRVSPGYAIDPCGNDIVVCNTDTVDVCDLIKKCKQADRDPYACPSWSREGEDCGEEEEWILALRYVERPSQGIVPLKSTSCDCGGGCGCSGKSTPRPRGAPAQCEPTVVCEGYVYEVFKKPVEEDDDDRRSSTSGSRLVERFRCCFQSLIDAIPPFVRGDQGEVSVEELTRWCCQLRDGLLRHIERNGTVACLLREDVLALDCPRPGSANLLPRLQATLMRAIEILLQLMIDCLCSALLPPNPLPAKDPRVPLAAVTVRTKDCRVLRVCNWTPCRKFAASLPNLGYWTSIIPITEILRDLVHRLCCTEIDLFDDQDELFVPDDDVRDGAVVVNAGAARARRRAEMQPDGEQPPADAAPPPNAERVEANAPRAVFDERVFGDAPTRRAAAFVHLIRRAGDSQEPIDPVTFVTDLLSRAPEGMGLDAVQKSNLAQFLLLDRMARPVWQAVREVGRPQPEGQDDDRAELERLRARLDALERRLPPDGE